MLWILACVAIALLCYEIPTLITAVLQPLWTNGNALQTDYHYYYDAARRFSGDDTLLYLATDDVIAGFAYPPPAILPFMLLSWLSLGAGLLLLTIASYAALLVAVRVWLAHLGRHGVVTDRRTRIAIGIVAVAAAPTYMNAIFGQVNAFVLVSSVVFVAAADVAPVAAGAFLATGMWLKIYPALLLAVGAWDRRTWRAIGYAIAAALLIVIVATPIIPPAAYRAFLFDVLPARIDKTAIHITNQSLVAFLERFRVPSELFLNWTGQQAVTTSPAFRAVNLGFLVGSLFALFNLAKMPNRTVHASAILMALVAVAAPLGWGHTYMMALPLLMLHLASMRDAGRIQAMVVAASVVALMIPAGRRFAFIEAGPDWFQNVMYSRYLLATLALILISASPGGRRAESPAIAPA